MSLLLGSNGSSFSRSTRDGSHKFIYLRVTLIFDPVKQNNHQRKLCFVLEIDPPLK